MNTHNFDKGIIRVVGINTIQERFEVDSSITNSQSKIEMKLVIVPLRAPFLLLVDGPSGFHIQVEFASNFPQVISPQFAPPPFPDAIGKPHVSLEFPVAKGVAEATKSSLSTFGKYH